jgi:hypothetical protein
MTTEPPVYRPFALLALAATLLAGTPLGTWMLARLYWGGGPVPPEHVWLHAHLQGIGFFGTLIVGVAHHLVPRFAGRPVASTRLTPWLAAGLAAALALRLAAAGLGPAAAAAVAAAAALLQAAAFAAFGAWLRGALRAPALRVTRAHLTAATAWLVLALALEAGLRAWAAWGADPGAGLPAGGMRAVHAMALLGGVLGWITGVLVRAGPMLVARWTLAAGAVRALPWLLAAGVAGAALGAAGPWPEAWRAALERAGEAVALGTVAAVAVAGGAFRRPRGVLPMAARGGPETWLFRLAVVSAAAAATGSAVAAGLAGAGVPLSLLADALRHLVTVGVLTSVVVGMGFRLVPVFEGVPLPWPRLRVLAFWALLAALGLRTAEVLADYGLDVVLGLVPLSGPLVWTAVAALAASLLGAIRRRRRAMTAVIGAGAGRP